MSPTKSLLAVLIVFYVIITGRLAQFIKAIEKTLSGDLPGTIAKKAHDTGNTPPVKPK